MYIYIYIYIPLLMLTSTRPLKVHTSQGLSPCFQIELLTTGRASSLADSVRFDVRFDFRFDSVRFNLEA